MAKLNKEALDTLVQSQIDSVVSLVANTDSTDVFFTAFSGGQLNPGRCSVQTSADLPDPTATDLNDGTIVYVDTINIPVILSNCRWIALDGRVFFGDAPGELWSWGQNICGVLADNTIVPKCSPVQEVISSTNWSLVSVGGGCNVAALKLDGTIWSWGFETGDGTSTSKSQPSREATNSTNWCHVSTGSSFSRRSVAVKTDGTLWAWGNGAYGSLGDGTIAAKSFPVQEISSSTNWHRATSGCIHSAAVKTDGTIWSWGKGSCGRLGDGTVVDKCSPVQEISSSTNWCQVSAGCASTSAIKADGTLWSWGAGTCGVLGDGTTVNKSSPVQEISSSTNWCRVTAGNQHSHGIKTDGTLWSWGAAATGKLGDGSISSLKTSPVQEISSSTNWCDASAGTYHSSAIKVDGTLWSWGSGVCGRIGDGTAVNKSSPVQEISSSTKWYQTSSGSSSTSAIKLFFKEV